MDGEPRYLLCNGEDLADEVHVDRGGGEKAHPYSVARARERLAPQVAKAVAGMDRLAAEACPNDEAVAQFALHPAYIAKSYFPTALLREAGLYSVGSRSVRLRPEVPPRKGVAGDTETVELYVAGHRSAFRRLADALPGGQLPSSAEGDLRKIERVMVLAAGDRTRRIATDVEAPVLEVALHLGPDGKRDYVLDGFLDYLRSLGLGADTSRVFRTGGMCFVPVASPASLVCRVAEYSFVRVVRQLPRLRCLTPVMRSTTPLERSRYSLPDSGPVSPSLRVAVLDGGVDRLSGLGRWVTLRKAQGVGPGTRQGLDHGTAVTSALLFGSLAPHGEAPTPYVGVDHYRVIDDQTEADDPYELLTVLGRVRSVLENGHHQLVNLSIGPALPIDDDDVHVWTAVLDELLSGGDTLAVVAAGNGGQLDRASGNARVQSPADAVNALAVGACDTEGDRWSRAAYSSVGPGRSPGVVKPDLLAFGGAHGNPYMTIDPQGSGMAVEVAGTSFAAPTALRMAAGLAAHFGTQLTPLAIRALLIHQCVPGDRLEAGWGRLPSELGSFVLCSPSSVHVVYQGTMRPRAYTRLPVPFPSGSVQGMVTLRATLCYATEVDPQDTASYTRSGLEVTFRPHAKKRTSPKAATQVHADPKPFFKSDDVWATERQLRAQALKWETALSAAKRMKGTSLLDPVFDVHYVPRERGGDAHSPGRLRYAFVVSIDAPGRQDLYDQVVARYPSILQPLRSMVQARVGSGPT